MRCFTRELGELTDTRLRTFELSLHALLGHFTDHGLDWAVVADYTNGLHDIGPRYGLVATDYRNNGHGQALYLYSSSHIVVSAGIFNRTTVELDDTTTYFGLELRLV